MSKYHHRVPDTHKSGELQVYYEWITTITQYKRRITLRRPLTLPYVRRRLSRDGLLSLRRKYGNDSAARYRGTYAYGRLNADGFRSYHQWSAAQDLIM